VTLRHITQDKFSYVWSMSTVRESVCTSAVYLNKQKVSSLLISNLQASLFPTNMESTSEEQ